MTHRAPAVLAFSLLISPLAAASAADEPPSQPISTKQLTPRAAGLRYRFDTAGFLASYQDHRQWSSQDPNEETTQSRLRALVKQLRFQELQGEDGVFGEDDALTFLFRHDGKLRRVTYQGRYVPDFRSQRLVGRHLFDIHLNFDPSGQAPRIVTEYSGSPISNPVLGGIAKLIAAVAGSWGKMPFFAPRSSAKGSAGPSALPLVSLEAFRVDVPSTLMRSMITIQDSASLCASAEELDSREITTVRSTPAAEETLVTKTTAARKDVKTASDPVSATETTVESETSRTSETTADKDTRATKDSETTRETSTEKNAKTREETRTVCEGMTVRETVTDEKGLTTAKETRTTKHTRTVADMELGADGRAAGAVALATKYVFGPATTVEVGLGVAPILRTSLNDPARVDATSKNLIDDTPTTPITYVAFNWRPWGYDECTPKPTPREALRLVFGPTITPNPGFVAGVGFSPYWWPALRPFSVQAGYSVMLANVRRSNDILGAPPTDKDRQTKRGALGSIFLGIGYGLN